MDIEIIVAIITGCVTVLAAIIAGIFKIVTNNKDSEKRQKIIGSGNIQAGQCVDISGGVDVDIKTNSKGR